MLLKKVKSLQTLDIIGSPILFLKYIFIAKLSLQSFALFSYQGFTYAWLGGTHLLQYLFLHTAMLHLGVFS